MRKLWCLFFMFWPIVAIWALWASPGNHWGFPYGNESATPVGKQIDDLFYLILVIVTIVFIGTQIAIGYVLWKGAGSTAGKAWYSHGSHNLEVIWTIVPSGILMFISLFQLDVIADIRIKSRFPEQAKIAPIAEVTARQFEWRIRYPSPATSAKWQKLISDDRISAAKADVKDWLENPRKDDLYSVNDLHVPADRPVQISLRSDDVQHSLFFPELRVKQDAVPGMTIPVWFEVENSKDIKPVDEKLKGVPYAWLCAELCGWGHYKMKARVVAQTKKEFDAYLNDLAKQQNEDGFIAK